MVFFALCSMNDCTDSSRNHSRSRSLACSGTWCCNLVLLNVNVLSISIWYNHKKKTLLEVQQSTYPRISRFLTQTKHKPNNE